MTCHFEKLSHLIVTYLGYTMDSSWNEIFMDQEACMAHDSSDSSNDSNYVPSESDGESDDDIGTSHQKSFNIPVGQEVAGKVVKVLELMEELGINLTTFLDAVSWGNDVCISSSKVRTARTGLMNSEKLPGILHRWWKPPLVPGSGNPRPKGAGTVMENFAQRCCCAIADRELERLAGLFKSPSGEDVAEEKLTGTIFEDTIQEVKKSSPYLWSLLYGLAHRERQNKNTHKNPNKVSGILT